MWPGLSDLPAAEAEAWFSCFECPASGDLSIPNLSQAVSKIENLSSRLPVVTSPPECWAAAEPTLPFDLTLT